MNKITEKDCYNLCRLIDTSATKTNYFIKEYAYLFVISFNRVEVLVINKDLEQYRIKPEAQFSPQVQDLIFKTINWLTYIHRYE